MTVEDAVLLLDHHRRHNGLFTRTLSDPWAEDFVRSVSGYVRDGSPLSIGQGRIAVRLFYRCRAFMIARGASEAEVEIFLKNPVYHRDPAPSADIPREVRHLGGDLLGFRFKSNRAITRDLENCAAAAWLGRSRAWVHREPRVFVLPVTQDNVATLVDVIERHAFALDDHVGKVLLSYTEKAEPRLNINRQDEDGSLRLQPGHNEIVEWFVRDVLRAEVSGQDYRLPATPRAASRLLDLAAIAPVEADLDLEALAQAPPEDQESQAAARLISYGLRGLLLADGPRRARGVALAAARAEAAFPIVVVTRRPSEWKRHLDGLTASFDPRDEDAQVLFVAPDETIAQPVLARRRGGCLILDADADRWIEAAFLTKGPAREVGRTVLIVDLGLTIRTLGGWGEELHREVRQNLEHLFSAEEVSLLSHTTEVTQRLRARGFTRVRPADLYPLFGVVADLLGDLKPT